MTHQQHSKVFPHCSVNPVTTENLAHFSSPFLFLSLSYQPPIHQQQPLRNDSVATDTSISGSQVTPDTSEITEELTLYSYRHSCNSQT
uniref:Uncharacterized protein n=1 Tax=Octopus bimaculoides TaxID=37653 RepID=A0A0L8HGF7_OCTBM